MMGGNRKIICIDGGETVLMLPPSPVGRGGWVISGSTICQGGAVVSLGAMLAMAVTRKPPLFVNGDGTAGSVPQTSREAIPRFEKFKNGTLGGSGGPLSDIICIQRVHHRGRKTARCCANASG